MDVGSELVFAAVFVRLCLYVAKTYGTFLILEASFILAPLSNSTSFKPLFVPLHTVSSIHVTSVPKPKHEVRPGQEKHV